MTSVEGKEREDSVQVEVCEGEREREREDFREILLAIIMTLIALTHIQNNHHTTGN